MIFNLLFIYGFIVFLVGLKKESKDLKQVGLIGMGLAIVEFLSILILFGLSDM